MANVVGVRFKDACRIYNFDAGDADLSKGDWVIVETDRGMGFGWIISGPDEKNERDLKHKLKKVIRKASDRDWERKDSNIDWERDAFKVCREKIAALKLPMNLVKVEYLFDGSKAIFYFTAEGRVDFRNLVKELASSLHARIEMRQIGVRDEAKLVGGVGPCGRTLCCSTFLVDFEPVTLKTVKNQNITMNPAKLSGLCGRLMCCLTYENNAKGKGARKECCREEAGGRKETRQ